VACKPPPPRAGGGSHATPPQGGWLPLIATAQTPNSFLLLLKRKIVFYILLFIFKFIFYFIFFKKKLHVAMVFYAYFHKIGIF
jgi:nicotinamide riboside transporter PnuC